MKHKKYLHSYLVLLSLLILTACGATPQKLPVAIVQPSEPTAMAESSQDDTKQDADQDADQDTANMEEPSPTLEPTTDPADQVEISPAALQETSPDKETATPTKEPTNTLERTKEPTEAPSTSQHDDNDAAIPIDSNTLIVALEETLHDIYSRVNPSVVNIRVVQKHADSITAFPDIPGMPDIPGFPFSEPNGEEGEEFYTRGLGSGFVWNTEGYIVTNNHVIDGAHRITVTFYDGTTVEGEVVGADPDSDLAVVKVAMPAEELHPIEVVDASDVRVGQLAVAIGNPFGLESTMTVGFVSALGRSLPVESGQPGPHYSIPDIIQTDAPINPGNSGGVLVNDQGQLIAVPSAIASPVRASSGIGFAIPSTIVHQVVPVLIEKGHYEHAWLGISGTSMTPDIAAEMNLEPDQRGALVLEVATGGPSDKAGLRGSDRQVTIEGIEMRVGGDVIIGFDGRSVKKFDDLITYLARYTRVDQTITLTVLRDGEEQDIDVTLGLRPTSEQQQQESLKEVSTEAWLGIEGRTMSREIAIAMDLASNQQGILVVQVERESPADEAGLKGSYKNIELDGERVLIGGDIITATNNQSLRTGEELQAFLHQAEPGDEVTLTIIRDGEEQEVTVTLGERP